MVLLATVCAPHELPLGCKLGIPFLLACPTTAFKRPRNKGAVNEYLPCRGVDVKGAEKGQENKLCQKERKHGIEIQAVLSERPLGEEGEQRSDAQEDHYKGDYAGSTLWARIEIPDSVYHV